MFRNINIFFNKNILSMHIIEKPFMKNSIETFLICFSPYAERIFLINAGPASNNIIKTRTKNICVPLFGAIDRHFRLRPCCVKIVQWSVVWSGSPLKLALADNNQQRGVRARVRPAKNQSGGHVCREPKRFNNILKPWGSISSCIQMVEVAVYASQMWNAASQSCLVFKMYNCLC